MDFSKTSDMEGHYDDEDEVHFYYNRQERVAHAPQIVKDYYSGKFNPRGGLFKSLISTRGNKLLLICVVVCAASVVFLHRFGDTPYRKHIGNALMTAQAFVYGDDVYASVMAQVDSTADDKSAKDNTADGKTVDSGTAGSRTTSSAASSGSASGMVEAVFTAVDLSGDSVAQCGLADTMTDGKTELKTKFGDYDIKKIMIEVTYNGETKTLLAGIGGRK